MEMRFARTVRAVVYCSIIGYIMSQEAEDNVATPENKTSTEEMQEENIMIESHSFVALLDIELTDGTKRICTGAIIHDYVVITAAHCFTSESDEYVLPEFTASFVVIGSKKMFDTGYEQYLPIEKILSHPQFRGWSADLALVYTFADMTSDKPGKVIPLAGDKVSHAVDSNVTVLSWGNYQEGHVEEYERTTASTTEERCSDSSAETKQHSVPIHKNILAQINEFLHHSTRAPQHETGHQTELKLKSLYRNWRRQKGRGEKKKLTVETFVFVNLQSCKKVLDRAVEAKNTLKDGNDIVCYTSEEHYVTADDSGAPAVHRGRLVAVTVAGAEFEGDHVTIGMKMSCFCSWIADNLPSGGENFNCCKNCCEVKHEESIEISKNNRIRKPHN